MNKKNHNGLFRAIGLIALIIYGVGDILGAGIYALVGKIANHAGSFTWLSFAIAMGIILFTALSYSELGSRFPKSGGVSVYIHEAFQHEGISIFAGLLLFSATIFSMATLSQAFVGYFNSFGFHLPNWLGIFIFFTILLLINLRGIRHSSIANIICTTIEISGLLIVLVCGFWYLSKSNLLSFNNESNDFSIRGIFQGTALAFFAFTGFEDLANIAEEVKQPEKNLPRGILFSLSIAGLLYLGVSWIATAIIPGKVLGQSSSPLLDVVVKSYPAIPTSLFSIIVIFAVFNTTLLNYITASRLLYGMSKTNLLPAFLQQVHSRYYTPYLAIFLIFPLIVSLGIFGTLEGLASSTSAIVLTVFSFSCIALIRIKWKEKKQNRLSKRFYVPLFVPCLAVLLNMTAIAFLPLRNIILAAIFIIVGWIICWCIYRATLRERHS